VTGSTVNSLSSSLGAVVAGLGIAQLLHGHPWGYLPLVAGLLVSVPYFIRLLSRPAVRLLCPGCGSPFLWAQVGLTRKRNRLPVITAIHGELRCANCSREIGYSEFLVRKEGTP
jgi:hypothetical protein